MTWNATATQTPGTIISATHWNNPLGAGGSLDHLHDGLHLVHEELTYQSGDIWQFSNNYEKILIVTFNGVVVNPDGSTHYTESAVNQITFTTALKQALNMGNQTSATNKVTALYIKDE
jgi:hypothetical protein